MVGNGRVMRACGVNSGVGPLDLAKRFFFHRGIVTIESFSPRI